MSVTFKGPFKQRIQVWYGGLGLLALLLRLHTEHDVAPFAAYTTLGLKKLYASNTHFVTSSTKCPSQEGSSPDVWATCISLPLSFLPSSSRDPCRNAILLLPKPGRHFALLGQQV